MGAVPLGELLVGRVHDHRLWNFDPRQGGQVSKVCDHDTRGPACRAGNAASPAAAGLTLIKCRREAATSSRPCWIGGQHPNDRQLPPEEQYPSKIAMTWLDHDR